MQLKKRTFIISGGSSGLGLATTELLLAQQANVSILDLNPPPINADSPDALHDPSRTLFTACDVSSTQSISDALAATLIWIEETKRPLGGVITCAGIGYGEKALPRQSASASPKTMSMEKFDRVLAINLRGTVDLIRLTLPHMAFTAAEGPDGERGVVIVVSSVAAYEGQVGQLAYSASKGAVRSLVLPLARELGRDAGIRVCGIAPGVFETGMTSKPKPRAGPEASPRHSEKETRQRGTLSTGAKAAVNMEMVNYPMRMGKGSEFASLVQQIIENPMLNGGVIRLDGGVRMPSRL